VTLVVPTNSPTSRPARRAIGVAVGIGIGVGSAAVAAFVVWSVGFDVSWAIAAVLAVGTVTGVITTLKFDEIVHWDAPTRETPRGTRLALVTIEQSLAACDRLARPTAIRQMRTVLFAERDDQLARSAIARQMRALLIAELHAHGITSLDQVDDVVALLGPHALTILQPSDGNPVTTAAITKCLDALNILATKTPGSS
jgi:hypothetical protein